MKKLRTVLETYSRNFNMQLWGKTVLDPFAEAATLVDKFYEQVAAIDTNGHLSPEGKAAARHDAANAALAALKKWHEPRLA
jgi:hypothetical protein